MCIKSARDAQSLPVQWPNHDGRKEFGISATPADKTCLFFSSHEDFGKYDGIDFLAATYERKAPIPLSKLDQKMAKEQTSGGGKRWKNIQ
jgi:hypothetical protein